MIRFLKKTDPSIKHYYNFITLLIVVYIANFCNLLFPHYFLFIPIHFLPSLRNIPHVRSGTRCQNQIGQ